MFPKPLALLEPMLQPMHELKGVWFILDKLLSILNMEVLLVVQTKKLKFVVSIAGMIVNGDHGKMMDVNCLASRLLKDQGKTGNERLAKFNTSRLMEEPNVLGIWRCWMANVNLLRLSHLVVLAVLKVPGVTGLVVLFLVAMAARSEELVM
jgi:hypothetical protein